MGRPTKYSHDVSPTKTGSEADVVNGSHSALFPMSSFQHHNQSTSRHLSGHWHPHHLTSMARHRFIPIASVADKPRDRHLTVCSDSVAYSPNQSVLPDSTVVDVDADRRQVLKRTASDEAIDLRHPKVLASASLATTDSSASSARAELNSPLPPAFILSWLSMLRPFSAETLSCPPLIGHDFIRNTLNLASSSNRNTDSSNKVQNIVSNMSRDSQLNLSSSQTCDVIKSATSASVDANVSNSIVEQTASIINNKVNLTNSGSSSYCKFIGLQLIFLFLFIYIYSINKYYLKHLLSLDH